MRFRATERAAEPRRHVADPPVTGGGRELIGSRDRPYTSPAHNLGRFRWAVVALFVLAACSLVAAVLLTTGRRHNAGNGQLASGQAWSTWQPAVGGLAGAQEIADFLAPYYRATPASQLAVVTVVNLNNPAAPVQVVVPAGSSGGVLPLPANTTVVYNLCGEGSSNCSIGVGTPSANRLLLLRREALELALYTFKYIAGAQTVVAILPPGYTTQHCVGAACAKSQQKSVTKPLDLALLFARGELAPWLQRPLRSTFPESIPPTVSQIAKSPEAEIVSLITAHGMFAESTASAQDGSTVISLNGPIQPQ